MCGFIIIPQLDLRVIFNTFIFTFFALYWLKFNVRRNYVLLWGQALEHSGLLHAVIDLVDVMVLVELGVVDLPLSADIVPPGCGDASGSQQRSEEVDFDLATIVKKNNYFW